MQRISLEDTNYPVCKECDKSHFGYYCASSWKDGYCPECGPHGNDLLRSRRELSEFHGIPTGPITSNNVETVPLETLKP